MDKTPPSPYRYCDVQHCKQRSSFNQVFEFDRERIVAYRDCGLYFREISSRVGRNQTTVMRICDRWMQEVSARTIRRRLQQSGLSARCPLLRLLFSQYHRYFRRQWCDERKIWTAEWNEIVFTDESRFCLQHHDGRIRVCRHPEEKMLNSALCTATLVLHQIVNLVSSTASHRKKAGQGVFRLNGPVTLDLTARMDLMRNLTDAAQIYQCRAWLINKMKNENILSSIGRDISQWSVSSNMKNKLAGFLSSQFPSPLFNRDPYRYAISLFLINPEHQAFSSPDSEYRKKLLIKELDFHITMVLYRNQSEQMGATDLSLYTHSQLALCSNPRNFFGTDLVSLLERKVEKAAPGSYSPLVSLSLCNSGVELSPQHLDNIAYFLSSNSSDSFITDHKEENARNDGVRMNRIASDLRISRERVQNIVKRDLGLRSYRLHPGQTLSEAAMKNRLDKTKKLLSMIRVGGFPTLCGLRRRFSQLKSPTTPNTTVSFCLQETRLPGNVGCTRGSSSQNLSRSGPDSLLKARPHWFSMIEMSKLTPKSTKTSF
ncbi:hypothetical protein LAZ67_5003245 [Cordylochernes scorpioides]|uniref:Uncharacterized protein n=1 Tax=Cordylochernes scorpioides TaxID=51811 RepID=A0ABY6KH46_9ARAC|nr:hypothetical protein LAZ67_5003245 [Cordylochernes scorpioides]